METELDKPLGQHRKPRAPHRRPPGLGLGTVCGVVIALLVFFGSLYAALLPNGVREGNVTARQRLAAAEPARPPEAASKPKPSGQASRAKAAPLTPERGDSGATIQRTLTSNGLTVTKITPGSRSGDGPALIAVGRRIGQAPEVATQADPALVEDSRFGKLPKRGDDGARPMDVYARPAPDGGGTRIAIVVGGLGLSQTGTLNAIETLPPEVTLGFAATGNSLQRWMQRARETGHEILLQVPMQPYGDLGNDPGPHMLKVSAKPAETLDDLHAAMGRITNYTGIMNYLGGRFMSHADAFQPVLRDVSRRGLLFLDDGTASGSLTKTLAPALRVPFAIADLQLDQTLDRSAIMKRLGDLEDVARRNGSAIGVASAFDESVAAIAAWADAAKARGIEIVGVSALVDDPERKE